MSLDPQGQRWRELYLDLEMHRRPLFNAETHQYLNFEEQRAETIDEAEARRLFPRAFSTKAPDA